MLRVALVETELVGVRGECSYWAGIPSKTLLRPGEAVHGAREVAAMAEVDVGRALAWRDLMVSDYSDAGQGRWLSGKRIGVPLGVLRDTVQPFPTFSEVYVAALKALHDQIASKPQPAGR